MIPILTAYSPNFEPLYRRWKETLPLGLVPMVKVLEVNNDGFGFRKDSWYDAIAQKIKHFEDILSTLDENALCICSDVDIFFTRADDSLSKYIVTEMKDKDMLFMRENRDHKVNGGFYVVRNTPKVRNELANARTYCVRRSPLADQDYFNGDFRSSGVSWGYIDTHKVAWGTFIHHKTDTLFHHAVCATNLDDKLKQQDKIADQFGIILP
jgi:hypothetical protein